MEGEAMSGPQAPEPSPLAGEGTLQATVSHARKFCSRMTDAERNLWLALRDRVLMVIIEALCRAPAHPALPHAPSPARREGAMHAAKAEAKS
jgi:hypothetical protein